MKKLILILAAAGLCLAEQPAGETGKGVSLSWETAAVSSYLWRGYVINDSPSLQPTLIASYGGLTASLWGNFSRTVPHNQAWTEVDTSLEYARKISRFTLAAGFLDYRYPDLRAGEENRTAEVSMGVAVSAPLSPSFKVYHDVRTCRGNYYYTGVQRSFTASAAKHVSVNVAGGVGLNQHLYQQQTTISDVDLTVTVSMPVHKVVMSPFVTCMRGHRSLFGTHAAFGVKFSGGF